MKNRWYKKTLSAVLAAGMALSLAACGGTADAGTDQVSENAETTDGTSEAGIDIEALAKTLVDGIDYEDELTLLTDEELAYYVTMEDGVAGVMYMSSGSTAEEVAVFEAPDESAAKVMKENVEEYLSDQRDSFEKYIPEEAERIDQAVVEQTGNYVVLSVSGDSDKAKVLIGEAFGE